MTYEEVTNIIGGPGELVSEVGTKCDKYYSVTYSFKGAGSANATFTFRDGTLKAKSQFGLK